MTHTRKKRYTKRNRCQNVSQKIGFRSDTPRLTLKTDNHTRAWRGGGLEFRGAYDPFFCSKRIQLTKVKQPNIKRLMWNLLLENDTYAP